MTDITLSCVLVFRLDIVLARETLQPAEQIIQRDPNSVSNVNYLTDRSRRFSRPHVRVDNIRNICKVTRLLAVAIDYGPLLRHESSNKTGNYAGVLRPRILMRAEDVEITQGHCLETINAGEYPTVILADKFSHRVRR